MSWYYIFLLLLSFSSSIQSIHIHIPMMMMMESGSPSTPHLDPQLKLRRLGLSILFGLLIGFLTALILAFTIRSFIHYINSTPILKGPVVFSPKIHPSTLRFALDNPTRLLGSSPNGAYYYYTTALDTDVDFLNIALKRLHPFPNQDDKGLKRELQHHLQLLSRLRHPNFMTLRAYVHQPHSFTLVYDYMPCGSLEDAINKQLHMPWDVRLRIAVGIIKALNFLHSQSIFHSNLKPTNVLLDAEFEPKLTDSALMPNLYTSPTAYTPPETSHTARYTYTDKSDVFSFGVILGVLLTGRDPSHPFFGEPASGGSLGRWLWQLQQAGQSQLALDKSILGQQEEMLMALRIALVCMSDLPEDRPSSDELVPMLSRLHSF